MPPLDPDRPMYRWRHMTVAQKEATLENRRQCRVPWHSPPHYASDAGLYLITAACYEHKPVIGLDPARMGDFEGKLLETAQPLCRELFAWVILPNHYHFLAHAPDIDSLLASLGLLHGRTSYCWNAEEHERGRKVWNNAAETAMKSERHFWATLNYVLHNAVHHHYVERWSDWPYSNAAEYLSNVGRERAERTWRAYPLLDYGKDWDPPEL